MVTFLWLATSLEHTTKNQKIKIRDVPVRDVVLSRQKAADRNKSLARTTSVASMVSANIRKDRRRTSKGLTLCCEWLYTPSILESLYAYVTSPIDIDFYLSPSPLLVYSPSTLASEPPYAYVTSAIDIDFFSSAFPPSLLECSGTFGSGL
jgi:hypothetical protein